MQFVANKLSVFVVEGKKIPFCRAEEMPPTKNFSSLLKRPQQQLHLPQNANTDLFSRIPLHLQIPTHTHKTSSPFFPLVHTPRFQHLKFNTINESIERSNPLYFPLTVDSVRVIFKFDLQPPKPFRINFPCAATGGQVQIDTFLSPPSPSHPRLTPP